MRLPLGRRRAAGRPRRAAAATRLACSSRDPIRWIASGSRTIAPTRIRGSSDGVRVLEHDLAGRAAPALAAAPASRCPCRRTRSTRRVGRSRPTISRPSVVLPQPDSPTRPNVVPRRTSQRDAGTACTSATRRCSTPAVDRELLDQASLAARGGPGRRSTAPGADPSIPPAGCDAGVEACRSAVRSTQRRLLRRGSRPWRSGSAARSGTPPAARTGPAAGRDAVQRLVAARLSSRGIDCSSASV